MQALRGHVRPVAKVIGGVAAAALAFGLLSNTVPWTIGAFVLCACACAYLWFERDDEPSTPRWAKAVLAVWILTLPLTILFAAISAMASEAGYRRSVYIFIGAAWTYPLSIVVAFFLRRKLPPLVFLPCLNVIVWFWAGSII
jgi:hypothetical protein